MDQVRISKEVDCVVAFSSSSPDSDSEASSSVLIYTSLLSLRAVIPSLSIKDCFITRSGILLIGSKKVTKVDFVGRVEAELLLDHEP